jgi:hypothetical protein
VKRTVPAVVAVAITTKWTRPRNVPVVVWVALAQAVVWPKLQLMKLQPMILVPKRIRFQALKFQRVPRVRLPLRPARLQPLLDLRLQLLLAQQPLRHVQQLRLPVLRQPPRARLRQPLPVRAPQFVLRQPPPGLLPLQPPGQPRVPSLPLLLPKVR